MRCGSCVSLKWQFISTKVRRNCFYVCFDAMFYFYEGSRTNVTIVESFGNVRYYCDDRSIDTVRNPRRNSVRATGNDNGTLRTRPTILRHLIRATSVTCRQHDVRAARHDSPGAFKKPRGDSFRVRERHPTRLEFQYVPGAIHMIRESWIHTRVCIAHETLQ